MIQEVDLKLSGGVSGDELEQVLSDKMPPIARNVVLIDFDATIKPFSLMFDFTKPYPGVAVFTQELRRQGKTIGIFTSRLSPTWLQADNQDEDEQRTYLKKYCEKFGIHFDFATAEKIPCEAYIDDKAIRFEENWAEIAERWAIDVTK